MFKFNKENTKAFMMGALMMLVVSTTVVSVAAASKYMNINVSMGGIKLYVDGKLAVPTDSGGKKVESLIYDGTTYLPLRALSNILTNNTKEVKWDSDTQSVYIGEVPIAASTDFSTLKKYHGNLTVQAGSAGANSGNYYILDKPIVSFNYLDSTFHYSNSRRNDDITYMLDSKYSEINGLYVIPYTSLGDKTSGKMQFYNVSKNGTETLIKEYSAMASDDPIPVKVNLRGVEILKIKFIGNPSSERSLFYDISIAGR